MAKKNLLAEDKDIKEIDMNEKASNDFMRYATSVIKSRAVPNVVDNLKPVHRRILYTLSTLKLNNSAKTSKCANVTGAALQYHPHGDASVYDALIRLSQDWKMRYPLVVVQGNNGSLTGDGPAASRYTECKLSKIGDYMLEGLDPDVVNFIPNYDDTKQEPTELPSKFPNILCNGNEGIAVGMSSKLVPHNLVEVANAIKATLDNPAITVDGLMQHIKGPDFPLGSIIIDGEKLKEIYTTGNGTITLRAKAEIDEKKNTIKFSEFPFLVDVETRIIASIKKMVLDGYEAIESVENHIGKNSRHIIVVLNKKANPKKVLMDLYDKTPLQKSQSINHLVIKNGVPVVMGLKDLIRHYISHQHNIIIKSSSKELKKQKHILHIQQGLRLATLSIDNVINIVRNSDTKDVARKDLIKLLGIDEEQADAVLALQLGRLTRLDVNDIDVKIKNAEQEIEHLGIIIKNSGSRVPIIKDCLDDMVKKFGDDRRTTITSNILKEEKEQFNKGMVFILSDGRKEQCTTEEFCDLFKKGGKFASANIVDWSYNDGYDSYVVNKDGTTSQIYSKELSTKNLYIRVPKKYLITVSKNGLIKKSLQSDYKNLSKLCKIKEGDELEYVFNADDEDMLVVVDDKDKIKYIPMSDIKISSKLTMGVMLCKDHKLTNVFVAKKNDLFFTRDKDNHLKTSCVEDLTTNFGALNEGIIEVGIANNNMFINENGKLKEINWKDYSVKAKNAIGATITKNPILRIR